MCCFVIENELVAVDLIHISLADPAMTIVVKHLFYTAEHSTSGLMVRIVDPAVTPIFLYHLRPRFWIALLIPSVALMNMQTGTESKIVVKHEYLLIPHLRSVAEYPRSLGGDVGAITWSGTSYFKRIWEHTMQSMHLVSWADKSRAFLPFHWQARHRDLIIEALMRRDVDHHFAGHGSPISCTLSYLLSP